MQGFHTRALRCKTVYGAIGAVLLVLAVQAASAQDTDATIAIGYQRGLAYLPVILMEQQHLFEKQATRLGIKTTAEYRLLGGPSPIVDGLLGGALQAGVVGTPSAILLTDNTKDIKLDCDQLAYAGGGASGQWTMYNTIATPRGGQY